MGRSGLVHPWARVGRDRQKKEAAGWVGLDWFILGQKWEGNRQKKEAAGWVGLDWFILGQEWGRIDRKRKLLDG